jgi:hypothetical protein
MNRVISLSLFYLIFVSFVGAFSPLSSMLSHKIVSSSHLKRFSKVEENETDDQMRERLRQKMRRNLYNEKGVAFAPWVTRQIDEEVTIFTSLLLFLFVLFQGYH